MRQIERLEASLRAISDIVTDDGEVSVANKVYRALWDTIYIVRDIESDMNDLEQRIEELENCV